MISANALDPKSNHSLWGKTSQSPPSLWVGTLQAYGMGMVPVAHFWPDIRCLEDGLASPKQSDPWGGGGVAFGWLPGTSEEISHNRRKLNGIENLQPIGE